MEAETVVLSRVGVLGDVHAQDEALERTLAFFERQGVGAVLCVGDLVDGPGDADRTIARLIEAGVYAVGGNHDRWLLAGERRRAPNSTDVIRPETERYLAALPPTRLFSTPAGNLLLCHGVGDDDMAALRPDTTGYALQDIPHLRELMLDPEVQYVVGGHTHVRMVRTFPGLVFVNAGTLLPAHEPCALVLDFAEKSYAFYDLGPDGELRPAAAGPLPEPLPVPDLD